MSLFSRITAGLSLALITSGVVASTPVQAQDWKAQFKTIQIGFLSGENEKERRSRNEPFRDYLQKNLGVEVKIFTASSYAGVIQALASNQIEFAFLGSSAYAAAWEVSKGKVEPLLSRVEQDGSTGYFAIVVVKQDSPFKKIEDLKGKMFAFADPNSTSGYQVPYFYLRKGGINSETHFGKVVFSGSHENGVLGVVNGQFDGAATHMTNEHRGIPASLMARKMIPQNSVRIIWKSPEISSGPFTARGDLPSELKQQVTQLIFDMPQKDPAAFDHMAKGQKGWLKVDHSRYAWIITMRDEIRKARRQRSQ
jgi:phosphonate transport system substrate-binding protein